MFTRSAEVADGDRKMRDTLGGKGAGLAEMSKAAFPSRPASPSRPRSVPSVFREQNSVPKEVRRAD